MMNVGDVVLDVVRRRTHVVRAPVGNDGLTEQERLADVVAYRSGVGRRPEATPELRSKFDVVAEKLAGTSHAVRRPAR
jgi:hypothetical protein